LFGVSSGTWFFLRALWDKDDISQRQLARRVCASPPTTLAALRVLRKKGFITFKNDREDRRRHRVALTERGRALRDKLIPRVAEINAIALSGLSKRDVEELRRMLWRVKENAERNTVSVQSRARPRERPASRSSSP
jgi:MarR family transcriptional regulator, organic hydroperoxide resistance regulator